jgi:hypothetical protein
VLIRNGELWQVDLQTGEIQERIKFAQPVSSSPTFMTEKEENLVVVGNREFAYQIGLQPLSIERVVYLGRATK